MVLDLITLCVNFCISTCSDSSHALMYTFSYSRYPFFVLFSVYLQTTCKPKSLAKKKCGTAVLIDGELNFLKVSIFSLAELHSFHVKNCKRNRLVANLVDDLNLPQQA